MLLRVSGEGKATGSDIAAVTDETAAESSGVAHAASLIRFADAAVGEDDVELESAREEVRDAMGTAALVDAAAVVGNFERMVRVADASGIPLDPEIDEYTRDIRSELELDRFGSSVNTRSPLA